MRDRCLLLSKGHLSLECWTFVLVGGGAFFCSLRAFSLEHDNRKREVALHRDLIQIWTNRCVPLMFDNILLGFMKCERTLGCLLHAKEPCPGRESVEGP